MHTHPGEEIRAILTDAQSTEAISNPPAPPPRIFLPCHSFMTTSFWTLLEHLEIDLLLNTIQRAVPLINEPIHEYETRYYLPSC